jgi:hypothetical protein
LYCETDDFDKELAIPRTTVLSIRIPIGSRRETRFPTVISFEMASG